MARVSYPHPYPQYFFLKRESADRPARRLFRAIGRWRQSAQRPPGIRLVAREGRSRVPPSEGRGHRFESCRARQISMTWRTVLGRTCCRGSTTEARDGKKSDSLSHAFRHQLDEVVRKGASSVECRGSHGRFMDAFCFDLSVRERATTASSTRTSGGSSTASQTRSTPRNSGSDLAANDSIRRIEAVARIGRGASSRGISRPATGHRCSRSRA
jgi:hypothetical protein